MLLNSLQISLVGELYFIEYFQDFLLNEGMEPVESKKKKLHVFFSQLNTSGTAHVATLLIIITWNPYTAVRIVRIRTFVHVRIVRIRTFVR